MTDPIKTIGKPLKGPGERDAIHVAIIPCLCKYGELRPGERVTLSLATWDTAPRAYSCKGSKPDGIVDPFLEEPVKDGEWFWLFLFPGTIIGLRHDWTHPAFPSKTGMTFEKAESEKWLRDYAERYLADYDEMVAGAISGAGYCFRHDDGPPSYRAAETEFWQHIENVTGKKFPTAHREDTHFRCAC